MDMHEFSRAYVGVIVRGERFYLEKMLEADVHFMNPRVTAENLDATVDGLLELGRLATDFEIKDVISSEDKLCLVYELDTELGKLAVTDVIQFRGEKVATILQNFDATRINQAATQI